MATDRLCCVFCAGRPHYAFFVEPKDFLPMLAWLRQNGVVMSEPWTRDGVKGLVYFRDPAEIHSRCTARSSLKRRHLCVEKTGAAAMRSISLL
jgi:hypothetical protein